MSYCVNCGVELDDGVKKCPLCETEVINPKKTSCEHVATYPVYVPPQKQKVKKSTVVALISLIFALPVILTLISDLSINNAITWSEYVISSVICAYLLVILPIVLREHTALYIMLMAVTAALYLMFINIKTGGRWLLTFAAPILTATTAFVVLMVVLTREKKISKMTCLEISMIFVGLFCILTEFLINVTFLSRNVFVWSLYPAATFTIISIATATVTRNKPLMAKLEKKFFI